MVNKPMSILATFDGMIVRKEMAPHEDMGTSLQKEMTPHEDMGATLQKYTAKPAK